METKFTPLLQLIISFSLLLLLVNTAIGSEIEGETPTIIKIVVVYKDAGVEDAKVELFQNNTILYSKNTNEYGGILFLLTIDNNETFEVEVSKEGFDRETENITVIPYKENSFEIKLRKPQEESEANGEPQSPQSPSSPSTGTPGSSIPPIVIETENKTQPISLINISEIDITTLPENITHEEILELFKRKNITLEDFGADIGEVIAGEEFSIVTLPDAKVMYCNQTKYADENGRVSFIAIEGNNLLIITKGNYTSAVPINAKKKTFEKELVEKDDTISPFIMIVAVITLILIILVFLLNKRRG